MKIIAPVNHYLQYIHERGITLIPSPANGRLVVAAHAAVFVFPAVNISKIFTFFVEHLSSHNAHNHDYLDFSYNAVVLAFED